MPAACLTSSRARVPSASRAGLGAAAAPARRPLRLRLRPLRAAAEPPAAGAEDPNGRKATAEWVASLAGVTGPAGVPGKRCWDPAGLASGATQGQVRRWREAELTHGRVCMLAAVGFFAGEAYTEIPAFVNADLHVRGPAVTHFGQIGQGFWEPLIIAIGVCEAYRAALAWEEPTGWKISEFNSLRPDYEPGNVGFDPLGLAPKYLDTPEKMKAMRTKELNNGRLAMVSVAGFIVQELLDNQQLLEHLNNDDASPIAAFLRKVAP